MNGSFVRTKAPLRLGLGGGGTDVSPYPDIYGGSALNATINMYVHTTLIPRNDGRIILRSIDKNITEEYDSQKKLAAVGELILLKGVYNKITECFTDKSLSFELCIYADSPAGSGLGTSSTMVVAVLGAFVEWLNLPLGEYDIAHLAYEIERKDLSMAGGKQDQYAATFGGFNFMEFYGNNNVIVNPLRIKQELINELEFNLVLYNTGTSRISSKIIEAQSRNVSENKNDSVEAMTELKKQARMMKEAILKKRLNEIGEILDFGWKYKKQTAAGVSNSVIDEIYETAKKAGATGGKISGAGGGGFMFFYCPGTTRYKVIETLVEKFGGEHKNYQFTSTGLIAWTV